jgi:hypothetical protein
VVWDKLYPALGDQPLPQDAAEQEKVKQIADKLQAHPAKN